jgi:hypothetical protein
MGDDETTGVIRAFLFMTDFISFFTKILDHGDKNS